MDAELKVLRAEVAKEQRTLARERTQLAHERAAIEADLADVQVGRAAAQRQRCRVSMRAPAHMHPGAALSGGKSAWVQRAWWSALIGKQHPGGSRLLGCCASPGPSTCVMGAGVWATLLLC
jgi:hypothetical protein